MGAALYIGADARRDQLRHAVDAAQAREVQQRRLHGRALGGDAEDADVADPPQLLLRARAGEDALLADADEADLVLCPYRRVYRHDGAVRVRFGDEFAQVHDFFGRHRVCQRSVDEQRRALLLDHAADERAQAVADGKIAADAGDDGYASL